MVNFLQEIASFWSSPFRKESEETTTQTLENSWVDVEAINKQVDTSIEEQSVKTLSKDKVTEIIRNAPEWSNPEKIITWLLDRGFNLEWLDPDDVAEMRGIQDNVAPDQELDADFGVVETIKEEPGFLDESLQRLKDEPILSTVGAAAAQVPDIISNIWGFFIWKPVDAILEKAWVDAPSLEAQFKADWIETKEQFQDVFWVDPEDFTTGLWEFWAEAWAFFVPWGQAKLAAKFPQAVEKIGKLWAAIEKVWATHLAPAIFNTLKSAFTWAKWVAQFEVVSEWEVTLGWAAIWAVAWPVIDKAAKFIAWPTWQQVTKKINERFGKLAQTLSPSKTTKLLAEKEIKKGTEWALLIRQQNPDIRIEEVWQVLDLSKKTRDLLGRQLSSARWVGNINAVPVVNWIDDVISVLKEPAGTKAKTLALDKKLTKEISALESLPNRKSVIKALENSKEDLLSRWLQSLKQADDQIIGINNNLSSFFSGKSDKLTSQVDSAVASRLRKNLDDTIWGLWAEFRAIKKSYWDVRTFENNLNKVFVQELKKKDAQLWDYADTFILGNIGSSLAAWDLAGLTKWLLQKGIKEQIKKRNDPNFVLREMFKLIDKSIKPETAVTKWAKAVSEKLSGGWSTGFNKVGATKSAKVAKPSDVKNAVWDLMDELARKTWWRADLLPELIEAPIRATVWNLLDALTGTVSKWSIAAAGWKWFSKAASKFWSAAKWTSWTVKEWIAKWASKASLAETKAWLSKSAIIAEKSKAITPAHKNLRSQISQIEDLWTLRGSVWGFKVLNEPKIPQAAKDLLRDINTLTPEQFVSKMWDIMRKAKFKKDIMPLASNMTKLIVLSELGVRDWIIDKLKETMFKPLPKLEWSTPRW